jgi:hypothetical protein
MRNLRLSKKLNRIWNLCYWKLCIEINWCSWVISTLLLASSRWLLNLKNKIEVKIAFQVLSTSSYLWRSGIIPSTVAVQLQIDVFYQTLMILVMMTDAYGALVEGVLAGENQTARRTTCHSATACAAKHWPRIVLKWAIATVKRRLPIIDMFAEVWHRNYLEIAMGRTRSSKGKQ